MIKKAFIFSLIVLLLLIIPPISAINIGIEKTSSNEVMVSGLKVPATFDLKITNYGSEDNLKFYNLLGFQMFPVGTIPIAANETKEIQLKISPIGDFEQKGNYNFEYFIKSQDSSEIKERLIFRIIEIEDVFEIGSGEFNHESNSVEVFIQNKANINFEKISVRFSSAFFEIEEEISLEANGRKNLTVQLDQEDFKKLIAGFYLLNAEIKVEDKIVNLESVIEFTEKNIVKTNKENYGFIIQTEIIEKTNEGNVIEKTEIVIEKNIISRLFTTFNPEPDVVERQGSTVKYTWNNELSPGETIEIKVKTNWIYPLLVLFFIIIIIILAKQYTSTNLLLRKKVSFVNAKGGEFALKVTILVNAKKYVEKVNLIDRLPPLVKVYEGFGRETPTRVDEKNKRLEWNFQKLEAGEIRMISYIVYSKVGVMGKFALPSATAIYEKDGEIRETESNRAFFVAEPKPGDIEEE